MLLTEQSTALARKLYQLRRVLPALLFVATILVMVTARPFGMIRENLLLSVICVAISALGVVLRSVAAGSTPPYAIRSSEESLTQEGAPNLEHTATMEPTREPTREPIQGGIYSVMRHPQIVGNLLICWGLLLYTGVWGWIGFSTLLLLWVAEKLATYHEQASLSRYGEPYRRWAEHTPAFIPYKGLHLLFKGVPRSSSLLRLRSLSRGWLTLAILFPTLLLIRLQIIEFTLEPPHYWWVIEGLLLLFWLGSVLGLQISRRGAHQKESLNQ